MAWNKLLPAGADKIKDSDDNIRLNNAAIETVLGTNITAGPTTIQGAIQGDATKGRKMRTIFLTIDNGTNINTLKCTVASRWNGDTIAETDNIALDATTVNFSLNAAGELLTIEASGLTGNVLYALGTVAANASGTAMDIAIYIAANDIVIIARHTTDGTNLALHTLVDTGIIYIEIFYITDA